MWNGDVNKHCAWGGGWNGDVNRFLLHNYTIRIVHGKNAKIVASVWGADFVQFLAALDVLPQSIWKNRMSSTVSSHH